jgi:putative ABC transport system ATP-binding protein
MREVSLTVEEGEFVAIVGTSGSGKSTMMNILGCLDRPTRGTYTLAGVDVGSRPGDSRAVVRNRVIGFVFQGFNLLSRTTALENVELPLQYRGVGARERRRRAREALEAVGLGDRLDHGPSQLSGGQQQRVAIARALVTSPPLLLADEPTGNLDSRTSLEVLALLQRLNRERGITIVLVTHERDIAACASRVVTMRDGRIVSDVLQEAPLDADQELGGLPSAEPQGQEEGGKPSHGPGHGAALRGRKSVPVMTVVISALVGVVAWGVAFAYLELGFRAAARFAGPIAALLAELVAAYRGSRSLRARLGGAPSNEQNLRAAAWHAGVLAAVASALLLVASLLPFAKTSWVAGVAAPLDALAGLVARGWPFAAAVIAACLALLALLEYLLLTLFAALPARADGKG